MVDGRLRGPGIRGFLASMKRTLERGLFIAILGKDLTAIFVEAIKKVWLWFRKIENSDGIPAAFVHDRKGAGKTGENYGIFSIFLLSQ